MITLPYMYGILLAREGNDFRAFRCGTHGKYALNGFLSVISFYLKETPMERLCHKICYSDTLIFIADELYQPDEFDVFLESGYFIALKAWREILEWGVTSGEIRTSGVSVGTQVFLNSNMMLPVKILDQNSGVDTSADESYYKTIQISQNPNYMTTDVNLNKLDEDGYPSWRTSSKKRPNKTYSTVVCYSGISPMIPSFTNTESAQVYTYIHRIEPPHDSDYDEGDGGMGFYTFYKVVDGTLGKAKYSGFVCASILQTPLMVVKTQTGQDTSAIENTYTVWEDPQIPNAFKLVIPEITEELLESVKDL